MAFQAMESRWDVDARSNASLQAVSHGQDAHATPWTPEYGEIEKRQGSYLPHWTADGAMYSVTFRLADSLPRGVLEGFLREREAIMKRAEAAGRCLTAQEEQRLEQLFSEKVERFLDAGYGACVLRDDRVALLVRDAMAHFDGERYDVLAWCVMPNHVHVVVRPRAGHDLSDILHSWKSFTGNRINRLLGRRGVLWQPESFDHLIRDGEDFEHTAAYVLGNPEAAGLQDWRWRGTVFVARPSRPWAMSKVLASQAGASHEGRSMGRRPCHDEP